MTILSSPTTSREKPSWFPLEGVQFDVERLKYETDALLRRVPLAFDLTRQLSLQTFEGSTDPWYDGCRKQREIGRDADYDKIVPELVGTYFAEVLSGLPFKPFRARLMSLDPQICYSVHRDQTPRYHMAIHTSYDARFVFVERQEVVHIPADGSVYFVDTREEHTAFNGAPTARVHLVLGGAEPLTA